MDHIKRQLNFNLSSDVTTKKKLRTRFDNESLSSTSLENLSNELFYEIFDYLDGCDIYKAFSNLNIRLQNLLICSSIPFKINLCPKSKSTLEHRCQHIIIPNKHRILSLNVRSESLMEDFFKQCTIDSSFNRLESIILSGMTHCKLLWILFYLNALPRLFSLTIYMEEEYYYNLGDIYRLLFSLSTLKYSKLSLPYSEELDIVVPILINEKFSSIEHLVVAYSCTVSQLVSLLGHTPRLCRLTCERLIESDTNVKNDVSVTLSNLTHISIGECHIEFDEFEIFIKKISCELQVLRISVSWNKTYLEANRWERLMKKHMSHLSEFHCNYEQFIDEEFSTSPGNEFINQFTSPFWLQRKWFSHLKIIHEEMGFSIHPYRKEWFDFHECAESVTYSNQNTKQNLTQHAYNSNEQRTPNWFVQLTVHNYSFGDWNQFFIDKIKPIFIAVQFTHLNISSDMMSIGMLIEIIRRLPNLVSLNVLSLPTLQLNCLSAEDTISRLLVAMVNKIIKIKLDSMTEMKQIQFLIDLCPRMQYFEVGCMPNTDLDMLTKYILINQIRNLPYLCCLCLNVPNANGNIIQNLTMIINLETLVHNYSIQRMGDKIFIQRNIQ